MLQNIKKISLIFFGIVIAFCLTEAALQLFSKIMIKRFPSRMGREICFKPENTLRIVCLGDSHTYGINLNEEDSYPWQLNKILRERFPQKKIEVFNLAYPDFTSAQILRKFQALYPQLAPDMVVAMAGRSDCWHARQTSNTQSVEKIKNLFNGLKTVKLLNILRENIQAKMEAFISRVETLSCEKLLELGRKEKMAGNYNSASKLFLRAFKQRPGNKEIFPELDDLFIRWNNPKKTVAFYARMLNSYPDDEMIREKLSDAYVALADSDFYKGNFFGTIQGYEKAFTLEPRKKRIYSGLLYNQAIQKELAATRIIPGDSFRRETVENLRQLAQICRREKIKLLFSQYPEEHFVPMELVAREYDLPIVEHYLVFGELLRKFSKTEFFLPDGHCKAKGNCVVAENIARAIMRLIDGLDLNPQRGFAATK